MSVLVDSCWCGGAAEVVRQPNTSNHHGAEVTIDDAFSRCVKCGEEWYTVEQSIAHTDAYARELFVKHGIRWGNRDAQARLVAKGILPPVDA